MVQHETISTTVTTPPDDAGESVRQIYGFMKGSVVGLEDYDLTESFVAISMSETEAERVIDAHEKVILSAPDWDIFYNVMVNPPEPNESLRQAARRYRECIAE